MVDRHHQTSVGTTPTVIEGTQYPWWVLHNAGGTTVYLGSSTVATTDGFPVPAGTTHRPDPESYKSLRGRRQDRLYGIVASGSEDVRVLIEGRINP